MQQLFQTLMKAALDRQQSFAFETNFHQATIFDIAQKFKARGFNTNLYFLIITTVEICKARVEQRVKVDAGHPVNEATIEKRFHQGLDNLNKAVNVFVRVFIYL